MNAPRLLQIILSFTNQPLEKKNTSLPNMLHFSYKLLTKVYYRIIIHIGQKKVPCLDWNIFRNKRHVYRFPNWFLRIQRTWKFIFGNGNNICELICCIRSTYSTPAVLILINILALILSSCYFWFACVVLLSINQYIIWAEIKYYISIQKYWY